MSSFFSKYEDLIPPDTCYRIVSSDLKLLGLTELQLPDFPKWIVSLKGSNYIVVKLISTLNPL
jgi:hypothetical protein